MALDLGTATTRVHSPGRGMILEEPSVVALDARTATVLEVGEPAIEMIGRSPGYVSAVRPLRHGTVSDFDLAQAMLHALLQKAGLRRMGRLRLVACVASGATPIERRALEEACRRGGAGDVTLVDQVVAGALGAGLPVWEPAGSMVVSLGGGTTEAAVLCLGGVVAMSTERVGGLDLDAALGSWLRAEHGLATGERTTEELKLFLGTAGNPDERWAEVRGRDADSGEPATVVVSAADVRTVIEEPLATVEKVVLDCLGETPAELAEDLIGGGIHLTGGMARLPGLGQRLAEVTELPVHVVPEPATRALEGAVRCLEDPERWRGLVPGRR
ncbi:MAG: rod shape-determining protein [Acidimicrobiales bacterium]